MSVTPIYKPVSWPFGRGATVHKGVLLPLEGTLENLDMRPFDAWKKWAKHIFPWMVVWFSWWFSSHGIESLKITFDKNKIQVLENNFFPLPPMGRGKNSEHVPPLMPRSELLRNPRQTPGNWPLFPNLLDFYANFTKVNIPLFVPWILRVGTSHGSNPSCNACCQFICLPRWQSQIIGRLKGRFVVGFSPAERDVWSRARWRKT